MATTTAQRLSIDVDKSTRVSALLNCPSGCKLCLVLAHGAGAGMEHASMAELAADLSNRGIATLRYQFPYMERGERRPDNPQRCHATVRAAVAAAKQLVPDAALLAGGKSFGGRMTSQAQAEAPLDAVRGIVFFGFPLHAPDNPSTDRGAHLHRVQIPMLFLQGTRDEFAGLALLIPLLSELEGFATLKIVDGADHSFRVLKRSGRTSEAVRTEITDAFIEWARFVGP